MQNRNEGDPGRENADPNPHRGPPTINLPNPPAQTQNPKQPSLSGRNNPSFEYQLPKISTQGYRSTNLTVQQPTEDVGRRNVMEQTRQGGAINLASIEEMSGAREERGGRSETLSGQNVDKSTLNKNIDRQIAERKNVLGPQFMGMRRSSGPLFGPNVEQQSQQSRPTSAPLAYESLTHIIRDPEFTPNNYESYIDNEGITHVRYVVRHQIEQPGQQTHTMPGRIADRLNIMFRNTDSEYSELPHTSTSVIMEQRSNVNDEYRSIEQALSRHRLHHQLSDESGNPIEVDTIVDHNGLPLQIIKLSIEDNDIYYVAYINRQGYQEVRFLHKYLTDYLEKLSSENTGDNPYGQHHDAQIGGTPSSYSHNEDVEARKISQTLSKSFDYYSTRGQNLDLSRRAESDRVRGNLSQQERSDNQSYQSQYGIESTGVPTKRELLLFLQGLLSRHNIIFDYRGTNRLPTEAEMLKIIKNRGKGPRANEIEIVEEVDMPETKPRNARVTASFMKRLDENILKLKSSLNMVGRSEDEPQTDFNPDPSPRFATSLVIDPRAEGTQTVQYSPTNQLFGSGPIPGFSLPNTGFGQRFHSDPNIHYEDLEVLNPPQPTAQVDVDTSIHSQQNISESRISQNRPVHYNSVFEFLDNPHSLTDIRESGIVINGIRMSSRRQTNPQPRYNFNTDQGDTGFRNRPSYERQPNTERNPANTEGPRTFSHTWDTGRAIGERGPNQGRDGDSGDG